MPVKRFLNPIPFHSGDTQGGIDGRDSCQMTLEKPGSLSVQLLKRNVAL